MKDTLATLLLMATLGAVQAQVADPTTRAAVDAEIRSLLAAGRGAPARFTRFRFDGEVRLPIQGNAHAVERSTPWMRTQGQQDMVLSNDGLGTVWDSRWALGEDARIDVRDLYFQGRTHIWAVRGDGRVLIDDSHGEIGRTCMLRVFAEATQSPTLLRTTALDFDVLQAF